MLACEWKTEIAPQTTFLRFLNQSVTRIGVLTDRTYERDENIDGTRSSCFNCLVLTDRTYERDENAAKTAICCFLHFGIN